MYTKTAQCKLERDVERARRENFGFAAKLVRGAYIVIERKVKKTRKKKEKKKNRQLTRKIFACSVHLS